MDREQEERQFLGFFGIIKESIKIIFTWRKIFSQITLAFILPLSLVLLANMEISAYLFGKMHHDEHAPNPAKADSPEYNKLSEFVTSNAIELSLFTVISFVLVVIFFLLSKSAVVCAAACTYTSKSITFGGVMRVLPKVGKRFIITNLWGFLAFFVYIVVNTVIFYLFARIPSPAIVLTLVSIFFILYLSGLVYMGLVLNLACVISVVEEIYGMQAMLKSKNLIKGKLGVATVMHLLLTIGFTAILTVFYIFVAYGHGSRLLMLGVAILCFLFLLKLFLFSLVGQTVVYCVCKSYHQENIGKSPLVDGLEVHLLAA